MKFPFMLLPPLLSGSSTSKTTSRRMPLFTGISPLIFQTMLLTTSSASGVPLLADRKKRAKILGFSISMPLYKSFSS